MQSEGGGARRVARLGLLLLALGAGCKREEPAAEATSAAEPDPLPALRAFEAERRAATDFAALPPSDAAFGADPYAIAALPGVNDSSRCSAGETRSWCSTRRCGSSRVCPRPLRRAGSR